MTTITLQCPITAHTLSRKAPDPSDPNTAGIGGLEITEDAAHYLYEAFALKPPGIAAAPRYVLRNGSITLMQALGDAMRYAETGAGLFVAVVRLWGDRRGGAAVPSGPLSRSELPGPIVATVMPTDHH